MGIDLIGRLHRATHAIALAVTGAPDLDLNQAEAHILAQLHFAGASSINDLHATFGHRRSTLTSVLDRLERRGLVKRSMNAADRRSVRITLTISGKTLVDPCGFLVL